MRLTILLLALTLLGSAVHAQNKGPVIEWQKSLGGSRSDECNTIIRTNDNGYLLVGRSFSNDGDVTGHHGSTDSSDAWVVRLDESGNLLWQKSLGGSRNDVFTDAVALGDGDFICIGQTESDNGDVSGLHSSVVDGEYVAKPDLWAVRISSSGSVLWSRVFGGTAQELGHAIVKSNIADRYIIAASTFSTDGDIISSRGYSDIWVVIIDGNGIMRRRVNYGNIDNQFPASITATSDGGFVIAGFSRNSTPGTQFCPHYAEYANMAMKINSAGDSLWARFYGLPCGNPGYSSYLDHVLELPSGRLLGLGGYNFANLIPFSPCWRAALMDPSNGSEITSSEINGISFEGFFEVTNPGPHRNIMLPDSTVLHVDGQKSLVENGWLSDGYVTIMNTARLDFNAPGAFIFSEGYGGNGSDIFKGVTLTTQGDYVAAGYSNSITRDVTGNHGNMDFWVVKFIRQNTITGKAFFDRNNNGIKDAGEVYASNLLITSRKGQNSASSVTGPSGEFLHYVDTGTYQTSVTLPFPYYSVVPVSRQSTFTSYRGRDSFDFAVVGNPGVKDLTISLQTSSIMRPGSTVNYVANYRNAGTETVSNASVMIIKSSKTDFESAVPAPNSVTGDTLVWNLADLDPFGNGDISLILRVKSPPLTELGDTILLKAQIFPRIGDQTPINNTIFLRRIVTGSFDPNDKQENRLGAVFLDELADFDAFHYTIRFQNTGTDTAFNIIIRDTLSAKLNPASFQMTGSSHPYTFSLKDGKYATWTFTRVNLPDSNINEAKSHGYISYKIKPVSALQEGDTINNRASIYFDFNLPVRTNLQQTTVKARPNPPPPEPVVSGLLSNYCSLQGSQQAKISNLPASSSGILVTATLDGSNLPIAADSSISFAVNGLAAGNHIINVIFSNTSGSKSSSYPFTVTTAMVPDVNISSNITNVVNLVNPVEITASNVLAGGSAPLYTFGKNRGFTSLWQAESSAAILTIAPSSLTVGDNWIFVRMKSNATCVSAEFAYDSIRIVRDMSTGIVDPDNPGKIISVYPNPLTRQFYLKGLDPTRKYRVVITNLNGQVLQQSVVANQASAGMVLKAGLSGSYLLSLYDDRKNKLIGTLMLVRQ